MNFRYLIYVLLFGVMMCSCRAHKSVAKIDDRSTVAADGVADGSQGIVIDGKSYDSVTRCLLDEAYSWLGTPYKYGGQDKDGADCSGFVMMVYLKALDIKLPRVSREQGEFCEKIDKKDLYPGDLVFFKTDKRGKVSHVGIYVGDGQMIHASSHGVMLSDLSQKYYVDHYHHSGKVTTYHKMIKKR